MPCSFSSSNWCCSRSSILGRPLRVGRTVVALASRLGDAVAPPEVILLADRLGVLPQLSRWLIMHSVRMISELTARAWRCACP